MSRALHNIVFLMAFLAVASARAQGTFRNLDFESANLADLPGNQWEFVGSASGLPGWNCFLGTNQVVQITHNSITVGAANVGVLGPSFTPIFDGRYMAILQDGGSPADSQQIVPATISQTAVVPSIARSLQLRASQHLDSSYFSVSLNGQPIHMFLLAAAGGYDLYGGDVSSFSGQIATLSISSLPNRYPLNSGFALDDIVFSPQTIPEPSVLCLFGMCALMFGCSARRLRTL